MTTRKTMPKYGTKAFDKLMDQMTPDEIREISKAIFHNQGLERKRMHPHLYSGNLEDRVIPVPERLREVEVDDDD